MGREEERRKGWTDHLDLRPGLALTRHARSFPPLSSMCVQERRSRWAKSRGMARPHDAMWRDRERRRSKFRGGRPHSRPHRSHVYCGCGAASLGQRMPIRAAIGAPSPGPHGTWTWCCSRATQNAMMDRLFPIDA